MAQGVGWTVDVLPFEAVDGSEAEATTVIEATEVAADTRTAAGEAVAITIEVATSPLHRDPGCFFLYSRELFRSKNVCVQPGIVPTSAYISYISIVNKKP
jgi:hypothetical protein